MAIGLGIGIGISIGIRGSGSSVPRIHLSGLTIAEDAEVGDLVGTLSVANSPEGVSWTFTAGEGAPSEFALDESDDTLLKVAGALDHETDPTLAVPIVATSDEETPTVLNRTFTIQVANVIEAPVNVTPPAVTGSVEVGSTLSCSTGTWTDMQAGSFAYQWKDASDDSDIEGATASTLLLAREHVGLEVYCEVTATNSADSTAQDSNTVGPVPAIVPDAFVLSDWSIAAGDEEADVTINSLPDDGGDTITDVEYRLDGGSWVSSEGTSSFTIEGLTNDQEYAVELRAVNGIGAGAASDVKQVTPEDSAPATFEAAVIALLGAQLRAFWLFDDPSHLWQDTSGTTAVTSDADPLGRADDLSGNGLHLLQATAGSKPAYRVISGAPCVRFDGVNDFMDVAAAAFPIDEFELFAVCSEHEQSTDFDRLCAFLPSSGNDSVGDGSFPISLSDGSSYLAVTMPMGSGGVISGAGAMPEAVWQVRKASTTSQAFQNNSGSSVSTGTSISTPHSGAFRVGAGQIIGVPRRWGSIDIKALIVAAPIPSERAALLSLLYDRYGITP